MKPTQKSREPNDAAYDAFKEFEGQRYTGMKIGRGHKWYYDQGEWKEKKITPEQWEINYRVTKRRAGRAPEGSGVPVGTEYHWYILAHQTVCKLNANDYTTALTGFKYKLAHKRADKPSWSASSRAQRNHMLKILRGVVADLEAQQARDEADRTRVKPSGRAGTARKPTSRPKRTTRRNGKRMAA